MITFSIVIPTYNQPNLQDTISSIELSLPTISPPIQIIVSDSSPEPTPLLPSTIPITILHMPNTQGISLARHIGTMYAITNPPPSHQSSPRHIIISTDSDITVPPDWLSKTYNHYNTNPDLVALSGVYKQIHQHPLDHPYETITTSLSNKLFKGLGGNTSFTSTAYLISKGYNTSLTNREDIDLYKRFPSHLTLHDPDLYVYHNGSYRWRAASLYPLSIILLSLPSQTLKQFGFSILTNELINHHDKLKKISYKHDPNTVIPNT